MLGAAYHPHKITHFYTAVITAKVSFQFDTFSALYVSRPAPVP